MRTDVSEDRAVNQTEVPSLHSRSFYVKLRHHFEKKIIQSTDMTVYNINCRGKIITQLTRV